MTSQEEQLLPQHVAIIMDGNNRFAKKNQMQKGDGHREGKNILDPIVEHCKSVGVKALTVFAFSSENWNRPAEEVALLMLLLEEAIQQQIPRMLEHQIALRFIGDRSKLSERLQQQMHDAEQLTEQHTQMTLTIAISYGGMWDIASAAKQIALDVQAGRVTPDQIDSTLFNRYTCLHDLPAVDMLIRTGGDFRISNFLLWQSAYAELFFTETLWPNFSTSEFDDMINLFARRERRFGKTSEQVQTMKQPEAHKNDALK